jgi:hypothetical protein
MAEAWLGNRIRDFHIRNPATTTEFTSFLPGLLANIVMAQRSNPTLSRPVQ